MSANTAGVFHLRSPEGKYKMNFSQADAACQAESATLANFKQLGDAQQVNPATEGVSIETPHRSIHLTHINTYTHSIFIRKNV